MVLLRFTRDGTFVSEAPKSHTATTTGKTTEVTLAYQADFRRRGDTWAIVICGSPDDPDNHIHVKVSAARGELEAGTEYRFYGRWTENGFGRTFDAKSWAPALPCGKTGIVRCLEKCPGIGAVTATRMWNAFGAEAVHILIDQPEMVRGLITRLNAATIQEASEYLRAHRATIDAQCELLDVLGGRGFPQTIFADVQKTYGNRGPTLIRRNPFLLSQFSGAGFKRCDDLWVSLGLSPARMKRQTLCLSHAISRESSGSTWFAPGWCARVLSQTLSGADPQPVRAVKLGVRAGVFRVRRDADQQLWVTLRRHDDDELTIAKTVRESRQELPWWPTIDGPGFAELTDHQREQLRQALTSTIGGLVGAPGVGKTHVAGVLLRAIVDQYGENAVVLAAPTGKAARRLTELSNRAGVELTATTIHSLLGPRGVADDVWKFTHNADNPLPYQYIVIDETSMLDGQIAAALLAARKPGTHILFVGDPDQLPSVAPGAVLKDLIDSGLPHGRLSEILRNSGTIVRACHSIRNDETFQTDDEMDPDAGHNLRHAVAASTSCAVSAVVKLATRLRDRRTIDDQNFQVICATNKAKNALNQELRRVFNPAAAATMGEFAPGDKIINTKNRRRPSVDSDEQHYICNGELGIVSEVFDGRMVAVFSDPFREVLCFGGEDLDFAYAITGHKAQGSEWPYVVVTLETEYGAKMCTNRGWLYTALSRAKRACWLIGPRSVAASMCKRIGARRTFLKERIAP
jgi:exodeoxyribonuclease V alpha subunit